jgi:DeoR/GlpR family transcriptional regulator of sugar metabolism
MKPQVVAHQLSKLLKDNAIFTADCGTVTVWSARHIRMRDNMMFSCSCHICDAGSLRRVVLPFTKNSQTGAAARLSV